MSQHRIVRVAAISGSLRRLSSNTAVLAAAARLAPPDVAVVPYTGLADLPPFNPDAEAGAVPPAVTALQRAIDDADAVIISSPEYAHGVPGVLKNALDWLVGSGEFIDKPVAVVNASSRATHAWTSLVETLTTMSACVVREASITIALEGRPPDVDAFVADPAVAGAVRDVLARLAQAVPSAAAGLRRQ